MHWFPYKSVIIWCNAHIDGDLVLNKGYEPQKWLIQFPQSPAVLCIDLKEPHSTSIILKQTKNVFLKLGTIYK